MYKFSIPQNGYRQQKLLEAAKGRSTWLNYGPWLPGGGVIPGFFDVLCLRPSSSFVIHLLPSASSNIFIHLPRLHPSSSGVNVSRVLIHLLPSSSALVLCLHSCSAGFFRRLSYIFLRRHPYSSSRVFIHLFFQCG
ncbi:hypothetical protein BSL78_04258 [Apostichopus japonicus]|uniref:Uncharacterized protein n=1 Tax=Stichopus japonicus TaxID=307972 RepID=A0A2G8LEV2_STIJA|nr:hypothetical protein BSL78_04258 [Apostichopus japonicus]